MPPKTRKKNNTQKVKKRTGRKTKNTTFKNKVFKGGRKSLGDALGEKLTSEFIENLVEHPNNLHSIQIEYCSNNNFVVNTNKLFDTPFEFQGLSPADTKMEFKNMDDFTIPDDLQVGKQLEIVMYASEEGPIMYGTRIQGNTKKPKGQNTQTYHEKSCATDKLPVIYSVHEITTPENIASKTDLTPVINARPGEEETHMDNRITGPLPYDELTLSDYEPEYEPAQVNSPRMESLEDAIDIAQSREINPSDISKDLKDKLTRDARIRAEEEEAAALKIQNFVKRKQQTAKEAEDEEEEDNFGEEAEEDGDLPLEMDFKATLKDMEEIDEDDDEIFKTVDDEKAQDDNMVTIIQNTIDQLTKIDKGKSEYRDESDYKIPLDLINGKYKTMIEHIPKINMDEKYKKTILGVLKDNHERLFMVGKHASLFGTWEGNFKEKILDSIIILTKLNNFFKTSDERYLKDFGKLGPGSRNYAKTVGGRKTRKTKRKTKQRKTKKRTRT
jgi:hypothetical protein